MSYTIENSGGLWKNVRRTKDTQPDYTGKVVISRELVDAIWDGKELQLAAWLKEGKDGKKYLSLKVSAPRDEEAQ